MGGDRQLSMVVKKFAPAVLGEDATHRKPRMCCVVNKLWYVGL